MRVTFIDSRGIAHAATAADDETGMRCATAHAVPGIAGECGGAMTCGTCHVYVDDEWLGKLPPPSAQERDMLNGCIGTQANSRLSCQIKMKQELDGLTMHVPDSQT